MIPAGSDYEAVKNVRIMTEIIPTRGKSSLSKELSNYQLRYRRQLKNPEIRAEGRGEFRADAP